MPEYERAPEVGLAVQYRAGRPRLLAGRTARVTAIHGTVGDHDWLVALDYPRGTVLPTLAYHVDALWSDVQVVS